MLVSYRNGSSATWLIGEPEVPVLPSPPPRPPVDTCIHHGAMLRRGGGRRRVLARYASPRTSSQHVSTDTPGAAAYHTTVTHPSPSTKPDTSKRPLRHRLPLVIGLGRGTRATGHAVAVAAGHLQPHCARGTGRAEAAMIGADDTGGGGRQVPRRPPASFRSQEFAIASSGQINWMRFVQSSLCGSSCSFSGHGELQPEPEVHGERCKSLCFSGQSKLRKKKLLSS